MPCSHETHDHQWPASGPLTIERCKTLCQYCIAEGKTAHEHKHAWFLRRHVEGVHIKEGKGTYGNVQLSKGW